MRLSELTNYIKGFETKGFELEVDHNNTATNILKFKSFLDYIKILPFYEKELKLLFDSPLYGTTGDILRLSSDVCYKIEQTADYLINSFNALKITLPRLTPKESECSIDIKLPMPTDFSSLNSTLSILEKIISQVIINDKIKGTLNVNHWEYGSYWIELIVGSTQAVSLIAGIVWSAAVISKKRVEVKIFEEQARTLKLKNDSLDDILEAQKQTINTLLNDEAIGLLSKHFNNDDNEQRERIKYAIKEFATLIQDGAEIHPSLETPENVKNLFPNYKQIESIESQVTKQIEDKT